jgi:hypothetical protein
MFGELGESAGRRYIPKPSAVKMCSCTFSPTLGRATLGVTPILASISGLPTPENSRICTYYAVIIQTINEMKCRVLPGGSLSYCHNIEHCVVSKVLEARLPRAQDDFSLRASRVRLALMHKLDTRRDYITFRVLFISEQNPRHGRGNNHMEILA